LKERFLCSSDSQCVYQGNRGACVGGECIFPAAAAYGDERELAFDAQGFPDGISLGADGSTSVDGSASPDGALASGAGQDARVEAVDAAPRLCGKTSLLGDDFEDGSRSSIWGSAYNTYMLDESAGRAIVTPAAGSNVAVYAGYRTYHLYDLRDDAIQVEVPVMVNTASGAHAFLGAGLDPANQILVLQEGGQLQFKEILGGVAAAGTAVPYSGTQHRFWKLREAAGTTYWETSPDGQAWTVRWSRPSTPYAAALHVKFGAGTIARDAAPGQAHFDNFNGGASPPLGCPM
jgi:hypothetical protein